jgi:hypothetical protein
MAPLNFEVAKIAHNRNVGELDETWSTITLTQEKHLAGVTPSLEIGRVRAVLNKTDDVIFCLQEVRTDYRRWPCAVTARYRKESFGIHGLIGASK